MRDQVVLITGGSSGIGLAAARRFAREGARVILAGRDENRLAAAVDEVAAGVAAGAAVGGTRGRTPRGRSEDGGAVRGVVRGVATDVTRREDVHALMEDVRRREGRLDVLVNSAGELQVGPAEARGAELAEHLADLNYLGAVRTLHAALPLLRAGTRRSIVNVASLAARIAPPYMAAYAGSKFALAGYTHALRQELSPEGFHVGLLVPGPVQTPLVVGKLGTPDYPLLPGVGVLSPERTAAALFRMVVRRRSTVVVPWHLSLASRIGVAVPELVDRVYRRFVRPPDAPSDAAPPG